MPPVNTKEKMVLHLVSQPSDLSTAGVKDKELFIHNTLHRGSTDRATVKRRGEGIVKKRREGKQEIQEEVEKVRGVEREVKRYRGSGREWLAGLCTKGRTVFS